MQDGPHKGRTLGDIFMDFFDYILWCRKHRETNDDYRDELVELVDTFCDIAADHTVSIKEKFVMSHLEVSTMLGSPAYFSSATTTTTR